MDKWFTYKIINELFTRTKRFRGEFESLQEFVLWYDKRPHGVFKRPRGAFKYCFRFYGGALFYGAHSHIVRFKKKV